MEKDIYQEKILDEIKDFTESKISPYAVDFDQKSELPAELINEMGKKGYLAASLPRKYGGLNLDPIYYGRFTEEVGKACCAARALFTVSTSLFAETIMRWGTESQKETWISRIASGEAIAAFGLTEPDVGTDAKNIKTSYKKEGDKYILNGKKKWITFGDIADVFIIIACNKGNITAFIVERDYTGLQTRRISGLLAGRATYIAEVELNNVEVPVDNILGNEGGGFTYIVSTALDNGRYSIAWSGLSIAQAALEAMIGYSRERKQFGNRLCRFQLIKGILGNAVTKIHAARALCLNAGKLRKKKDNNAIIETTIAKYFTSKIAMEITTDAVQVHGGNGCYNEFPVERLFREAKILEIIEGTSQVQQEIISGYGLREYYKKKN